MSKVFKWLALILGVLLLLMGGITLFVRFYLSGELITAWITPPLEHYLHRDVRLADGRIGLRGFVAEGLEVRKEGASVPLIRGKNLELRWKFRELLKGRFVIHTLAFHQPEITLIRHEDGSLNIADLLPQKGLTEPAAALGEAAKGEPPGVSLLVSLLTVEDGRLTLVDRARKPQVTMHLTQIRSRLDDLSSLTPVPFELEGQIEGENEGSMAITGTLDLASSRINANLNLQEIDLARLNPFFASGTAGIIQKGRLNLEASLSSKTYDHIQTKGSLNLAGLQINHDRGISKALDLAAGFQLDATISQQTLSIDALELVIDGQNAKIQGLFTQWYQRPQLSFTLISPQIKLDELLTLWSESPPLSVATEAKVEQVVPQKRAAGDLQAASISAAAQPGKTVGELAVKATKTVAEPGSTPSDSGSKSIPLDAQGEIHFDWLYYNKLVVSNVDCQLKLLDGKLQVEPLSAAIYGGGLGATVKADVESLGPPFRCRIASKNVLLDEVIGALWPRIPGHWSGNVNQTSRVSGVGSDLGALKIDTDLNINEAQFSDHPLLLKLAELFQTKDLQQLHFSQVSANILTRQGVATIKKLHMRGPILLAEGGGTAGLLDHKLDLRLHLQIRPQYVGKLAALREMMPRISEEHEFIQLPLQVSGTFDEPVYRLDEGWLARLTRKAAEEPVKELEQEAFSNPPMSKNDKNNEYLVEQPQ